jgi:hypothetical protein
MAKFLRLFAACVYRQSALVTRESNEGSTYLFQFGIRTPLVPLPLSNLSA